MVSIFPKDISPKIIACKDKITDEFLEKIFSNYKIQAVSDCLDNWETRFLIDDKCKFYNIPYFHAGVESFFGQILISRKKLADIYKNLDFKNSRPFNIYPPINFVIGGILVSEIIKFITNTGVNLFEKIFSIDLFYNEFMGIELN